MVSGGLWQVGYLLDSWRISGSLSCTKKDTSLFNITTINPNSIISYFILQDCARDRVKLEQIFHPSLVK